MRGKQWRHTPKSKSNYYYYYYSEKLKPHNKSKSKPLRKPRPLLVNPDVTHFHDQQFTHHRHLTIKTTTLHLISTANSAVNHPPCIVATVDAAAGKPKLLHPLTLKPHHCNLPHNFNLSNFGYFKASFVTFHRSEFNFDKIVIPLLRENVLSYNTLFVLHGGGKLIGRPYLVDGQRSTLPWVKLSDDKFDDIVVSGRKIYVVDRLGKLHLLCYNVKSRFLKFNENVRSKPFEGLSSRVEWRKRLVADIGELYLVVREAENVFRVYKSVKGTEYSWSPYSWNEVREFRGYVLFVSKDCCFFMKGFGGEEYGNCIVFSESGFPKLGDDGWEYNDYDDDGIRVYRMSDGRYGMVGESAEFPEIDWSVPSWVLDEGSRSSVHPHSQTEGESDDADEGAQSDSSDSNSKDEEEQEVMELDSNNHDQEQEEGSDSGVQIPEGGKLQCDSNSHETDDEVMQFNANINRLDVPAFVSAVEEEVTQTLLRMNGGNEATEKDTSRTNITSSALRPCTSCKTKSCQNDSATAKFEGFDVRSDLVPTLQKIWRNHGNIIENSTIRNSGIIARALESLATIVQTLENIPIKSLSDDQVDDLSTTLSDLKIMSVKVHWLSLSVEKAVKVHESKALVDSLNKLDNLSTQLKERRTILLDEVAKIAEEENKVRGKMAKVSKLIPYSGQVKFDEPLGSGLT